MRVSLYRGDIVRAPADVVCTSTNPHLELILGTGGAIRDAGGQVIQDECRAHIERERRVSGRCWLEPGRAVWTGAGALPFRGVIHCVAIDAFHDSSVEVVRECVRNTLRILAGKSRKEENAADGSAAGLRVALPVLATGHGHLVFETSLRSMIAELKSGAEPAPVEVLFVIYEDWCLETAREILEEAFGEVALV